jgi:hypothetical protein
MTQRLVAALIGMILSNILAKPRVFIMLAFCLLEIMTFEVICSPPASCGRLDLPTLATLFLQRKATSQWRARWRKSSGLIGDGSGHIPKGGTAADGLIRANSIFATAPGARV